MKYQLGSLCVYILNVLPLWKINFYISAFDWLKVNNKRGFRLANSTVQRQFFKFFITKNILVRSDEFVSIPILSPFKFMIYDKISKGKVSRYRHQTTD